MSIFVPVKARCGKCGTEVATDLAASVNADRRPDLRQAILDRSFQAITCASCGSQVRLPAHLTYIDMGRDQWILVEDAQRMAEWREIEAEATALYDRSFGAKAPPMQRELGRAIAPRLVFGWPALREKLLAKAAGLDDTVLELLKIAVLRSVPGSPLGDRTELRLIEAEGPKMRLRWLDATTEQGISDLSLERRLYDDIAGSLAPWAELKGELEAGLFVDMKRLFMDGGERSAAAAS